MRVNAAARFAPGIIEGPLLKRPMRFNVFPVAAATTVNGIVVVQQNIKRVGLILKNIGTANVYISSVQGVNAASDWVIAPGEALSFPGSDGPTAPMNAIYATADAGGDLRVLESVLAPLTGNEFQA